MKKAVAVLMTMLLLACLAGCALLPGEQEEAPPPQPTGFSEVYNDGVTKVETYRLLRLPGKSGESEYCCLEVRLTNNGTAPVYYSSMLCLEVSASGVVLDNSGTIEAILTAREGIEGFETLDGVIDPGTAAEGFVVFEVPAGAGSFDVRLATDFCDDEWIEFSCAVS